MKSTQKIKHALHGGKLMFRPITQDIYITDKYVSRDNKILNKGKHISSTNNSETDITTLLWCIKGKSVVPAELLRIKRFKIVICHKYYQKSALKVVTNRKIGFMAINPSDQNEVQKLEGKI